MPSRGSGLAVAVASTTFSPMRTTAEPWACLANFPVSNEMVFTAGEFDSNLGCFWFHRFIPFGQEGNARVTESARRVSAMPVAHGWPERTVRDFATLVQTALWRRQITEALGDHARAESRTYLRMPSFVMTVL